MLYCIVCSTVINSNRYITLYGMYELCQCAACIARVLTCTRVSWQEHRPLLYMYKWPDCTRIVKTTWSQWPLAMEWPDSPAIESVHLCVGDSCIMYISFTLWSNV